MSPFNALRIAFVGYPDYKIIEANVLVECECVGYSSVQFLLNQTNKGLFFDIVFINFSVLVGDYMSYLILILENNLDAKVVIEYDKQIADSIVLELLTLGIHAFLPIMNNNQRFKVICDIVYDVAILPTSIIDNLRYRNIEENNKPSIKPKEVKILILLSSGGSYNDMAKAMGMKIDAFRYNIKKLYKKIGVNNKASAVDYYYKCVKKPFIKSY